MHVCRGKLTCRVAPFRSRAGRSRANTSSTWSTFATAGSCSSVTLGSTSSTVAAHPTMAVTCCEADALTAWKGCKTARRAIQVSTTVCTAMLLNLKSMQASVAGRMRRIASCIHNSSRKRGCTSHIFPMYACYPHSIAYQNALPDLLEDAPNSAQKLCLATFSPSPAKSLH